MRVFLTGVGCVGKTTIGKILAELLAVPFVDLDHEIEVFFGTSIERLQNRCLTMHSYRNEAAKALMNNLNVFTLAVSLGCIDSLIQHPASMTHLNVPRNVRIKGGITDGLVRVSVGLEDIDDLIEDLSQGLKKVS